LLARARLQRHRVADPKRSDPALADHHSAAALTELLGPVQSS
jgi:hypothetical protein